MIVANDAKLAGFGLRRCRRLRRHGSLAALPAALSVGSRHAGRSGRRRRAGYVHHENGEDELDSSPCWLGLHWTNSVSITSGFFRCITTTVTLNVEAPGRVRRSTATSAVRQHRERWNRTRTGHMAHRMAQCLLDDQQHGVARRRDGTGDRRLPTCATRG